MAESKFLKWQDVDRDGLIDVCDDDLTTPEMPCKGPCTPDPLAIVPNWKKQNIYAPFINAKICHFQITKVTPYTTTADQATILSANEGEVLGAVIDNSLENKFKEFEWEAINNLLDFCPLGARLNNEETRKIVHNAIQYKKYELDARPNSPLKLLFSVPFDVIYELADAPEAFEIEEEDDDIGWETVTYKGESIMTDALRVRKGLHFYSKLLRVSSQMGEGDAYYVDFMGDPTHKFNLDIYGDSTFFSSGLISEMINELKAFLATKGMALPDGGVKGDPFGPIFREKVTKIEFKFKQKKLRVLKVWTEECADKPSIYNKTSGSLRKLVGRKGDWTFSWNNQTLVNYFINLSQMARRLNSRIEQPWREFLETYTFPAIKVTKLPSEEYLGSCLYNNLRDELNEAGNDILDEVFGLGDLVAYLYRDTMCRDKISKVIQDEEEMNRLAPENPDSPFGQEVAAILAKNQRWAKLAADDDVVLRMCINSFAPLVDGAGEMASKISTPKGGKPTIPVPSSIAGGAPGSMMSFKGLFEEGLNSLKLCGLLDLLFDSLGCLLGGLSFEDAMPIIVKKALEAMGIEQFGELFVGLPPEQQNKMDALVQQKIQEASGRKAQKQKDGKKADTAANSDEKLISTQLNQLETPEWIKFGRPWDNPAIIAAERTATNPANLNNYEGVKPPTYQQTMNEMTAGGRTILSQLDSVGNSQQGRDFPVNEIMTAYIQALLEVYSDNLILIIDELGKFPGAPLIKDIMSLLPISCPRPPLFNPGVSDFLKSLDLAFCRKVKEIEIPTWNQALELKIAWIDLLKPLFVVARFLAGMIIIIVVNKLVAKICEILTRAVCKALETAGDIVLGLPGAIAGTGPSIREILRENICGEGVDDETLDNSVVDMMSILGLGPQAFANRDKTIAFANDLSLGVTRQEFADALTGKPSPEFLESADQLLEFVHTDFREALPNKASIARFAKSIGNMMPLEYREVLLDYSKNSLGYDDGTPANPSVCSSPDQLNTFQELRQEILLGRATKEQVDKMYCDLRDENLSDLELVTDILEKGIGPYVADKIPNMLSTPGCDDGLLPYEPVQTLNASLGFMGAALDALENDYLDDMLGTGFTFFGSGDRNFGFITMVMSDTRGNNLRNHHRKTDNRLNYVDFASNTANGGEGPAKGLFPQARTAPFDRQRGQYPYFVAEWLKRQYMNAGLSDSDRDARLRPGFNKIKSGGNDLRKSLNFESTNVAISKKTYEVDLEDLGYANLFGRQGISTFTLPDFGFNTIVDGIDKGPPAILEGLVSAGGIAAAGYGGALGGALIGAGAVGAAVTVAGPILAGGALIAAAADGLGEDEPESVMKIVRLPRKGDPDNPGGKGKGVYDKNGADICLDFRDNSMGTRKGLSFGTNKGGNAWSYGFEVQCFYSDIEENPDSDNKELRNRPDDNIRVQIVEKVNYGAERRFASPLAKKITAEDTRVDPFDLPNWIEGLPLLGWALENIMKLILIGFQGIASGIMSLSAWSGDETRIRRFRKFEFLSVDDSLDAFELVHNPLDVKNNNSLDLNHFPQYKRQRNSVGSYPPQVAVLADLMGRGQSSGLKNKYDSVMQKYYEDFSKLIGTTKAGWLYGAGFDFLTNDDYEYGIVNEDGTWTSYENSGYENEDMVLGVSYNEFKVGKANARVIYLDPMIFGGSYENPPLHVKPVKYNGWWGLVRAFFPDDTACKPHGKNMIDFDEIKQLLQRHYSTLEEDTRLYSDVECVRQVPFDRILPRSAKISLYTLILAAIRIYASTHIMKSIGTFSAVQPKFPDNFSSIYSAYIVERMEEDFKDAQPAFWENFNVFKDEEFWYSFLEQAVECYDFMVGAGEIEEPVRNGYLQRAADTINNLQTNYAFSYRTRHDRTYTDETGSKKIQQTPGLWESKFTGDAGFFETLRGYRERKNLEGVKSVEDSAKLILKELVNYELTKMGEKFTKNMQENGFNPKIFDLDYWLFENKCAGSEIKYRGPKIVETPVNLPSKREPDPYGIGETFPGPYYTAGQQFRVAVDNNKDNEFGYAKEYIGYYHLHIDDDGNELYLAGAVHSGDNHDVLTPLADGIQIATIEKEVIEYSPDIEAGQPGSDPMQPIEIVENVIPLGDVPVIGAGPPCTTDQPFKIEKYISINGSRQTPSAAKAIIMENPGGNFISDHYPGTLRIITNEKGEEVGAEGSLGVRYGLIFYYDNVAITTVEVDALDFKIEQFQIMQPSSKLFHCLLQQLKNDPKYKLLTSYVFSAKKVTATLAIYNDMGFLASVGEVTPGVNDGLMNIPITAKSPNTKWGKKISQKDKSAWLNSANVHKGIKSKPGSRIFIKEDIDEDTIAFDRGDSDEKQAYGLPNYWDDDLTVERVSFNAEASAITGNEGWEHPKDRPNFTPFTLHWDEWDRVLLRNSRARIKKMFRIHYFASTDKPGDKNEQTSPAKIKFRNLKARLFPSPGQGVLPWWQGRRIRNNPYNADGELCDGPDILG